MPASLRMQVSKSLAGSVSFLSRVRATREAEGVQMSNPDPRKSPAGEHERAVERLSAAKEEQRRVRGHADDKALLRSADDEVSARERWLRAVDDHNY